MNDDKNGFWDIEGEYDCHDMDLAHAGQRICVLESENSKLKVALKETLLELEQWNLTEGDEPARTILRNGFQLLKVLDT